MNPEVFKDTFPSLEETKNEGLFSFAVMSSFSVLIFNEINCFYFLIKPNFTSSLQTVMKHIILFITFFVIATHCSQFEESSLRSRIGPNLQAENNRPPVEYLKGLPLSCLVCDKMANNYAQQFKTPESIKAFQDYVDPFCDKLGFLTQSVCNLSYIAPPFLLIRL